MTVSHIWTIKSLEYADAAGLASVINQVNWVCVSDDGEGRVWRNDSPPKRLDAPDPATFEAYAEITEANVIEWLGDEFKAATEAVNVAAIQKLIDAETASAGVGVPW